MDVRIQSQPTHLVLSHATQTRNKLVTGPGPQYPAKARKAISVAAVVGSRTVAITGVERIVAVEGH